MAIRYKYWCPDGCGKKVILNHGVSIFKCGACGRTWPNKKSLIKELEEF